MPRHLRDSTIAIALLLSAACTATTGVTMLSPMPEAVPAESIRVFLPSALPDSFVVIAVLDYANPAKYQVLTLEDVLPDVKREALKVHANGLIVDRVKQVPSWPVGSIGITVRARAIRVYP